MQESVIRVFVWIAGLALLAGCATRPAPSISPSDARSTIAAALPAKLADREGWVDDIYAAFTSLSVAPSTENVCAVSAVIAQESSFRIDPVVPNLGRIAWKEIEGRAERVHVPGPLLHSVLSLRSPNGQSYAERIDAARTEKQLSDVYEDFIGSVPLGETLFADHNPIRTRGPMQVNVDFARQFAASKHYPYPVAKSIPDELFTRRGGIYFGVAHLLDYRAPYDTYRYRFGDFNAGQYSSRNAAFQAALVRVSARPVTTDGALLPHEEDAPAGDTELAARSLAGRLGLAPSDIHAELKLGRSQAFEQSPLYLGVFQQADRAAGRPLPRAQVPIIKLQGPKIERSLTTAWYADRVDQRFKRCLKPPPAS